VAEGGRTETPAAAAEGAAAGSMALPKTLLLTRPWQYRRVYAAGKRMRGPEFSLIFLGNETGRNRLGISVHGVRRAVRRNRIKRIIREFFRHDPECLGAGLDVVFAVRSGFAPDSPAEVATAVRGLLRRARK
jgi:ribonuclease P protein component